MLLSHCLNLEGIRHNSKDVIMALSGFLKEERQRADGSLLSLAYMDFTSCFTVFSQRLELLPNLVEVNHQRFHMFISLQVRIGADVPPSLKRQSRKHQGEVALPPGQLLSALKALALLPRLRHLTLKDVTQAELEAALEASGQKLTRLELHYMSRGVKIGIIGKMAPKLTELTISDSLVEGGDNTSCATLPQTLETCRLMRVVYRGGGQRDVLSTPSLRVIHMEGGAELEDNWLVSLARSGGLDGLQELVIRGKVLLGLPSLLTLSSLTRLQWLGDLQDWEGLMLDSTATRVIRGLVRRGWKEQMYENANSWDQE